MDLILTISSDRTIIIRWWVDVSYAVQANIRSNTGGYMSLGRGMVYSKSMSQKLNGKSSIEVNIIGVSDLGSHMFWPLYLLNAQD